MLKLTIAATDYFDDDQQVFIIAPEYVLELEHSLVSLSKWEAIWEKPFMGSEEKTTEETVGYIQAMCLTPDVPPEVFQALNADQMTKVNDYINAKMSATWFSERPGQGRAKREIITAEILYFWMFSAEMPIECETWHLNRFFAQLKVFNEKNAPPKKMNKNEAAAQRRKLNEQRKAQYKTSG
jgi:hypothetical protein